MKININTFKTTPKNLDFKLCIYGELSSKVLDWIYHWNLPVENVKGFTNIDVSNIEDLSDLFYPENMYEYVDGFSPNLNKNLHIGHISNLVIACALQNMGIGENFISIMGDTLDGEVDQKEAYSNYENLCLKFNYKLGDIYYASKMIYNGEMVDGKGDYEGTKVFEIGDEKIVGLKNTGHTTYFYQDVALASNLKAPTLYLTGFEQEGHFTLLKKMFPDIDHLPLGLVMYNSCKMSSSKGNVIFASDLLKTFVDMFECEQVAVNVLIGIFLKSKTGSIKNVNTKEIKNPKNSPGLYLSYTLAHIKSAGMSNNKLEKFNSKKLQYLYLKAKHQLCPSILLDGLIDTCKEINNHYMNLTIKDNLENQLIYQPLFDDLAHGMKMLGMHLIKKV